MEPNEPRYPLSPAPTYKTEQEAKEDNKKKRANMVNSSDAPGDAPGAKRYKKGPGGLWMEINEGTGDQVVAQENNRNLPTRGPDVSDYLSFRSESDNRRLSASLRASAGLSRRLTGSRTFYAPSQDAIAESIAVKAIADMNSTGMSSTISGSPSQGPPISPEEIGAPSEGSPSNPQIVMGPKMETGQASGAQGYYAPEAGQVQDSFGTPLQDNTEMKEVQEMEVVPKGEADEVFPMLSQPIASPPHSHPTHAQLQLGYNPYADLLEEMEPLPPLPYGVQPLPHFPIDAETQPQSQVPIEAQSQPSPPINSEASHSMSVASLLQDGVPGDLPEPEGMYNFASNAAVRRSSRRTMQVEKGPEEVGTVEYPTQTVGGIYYYPTAPPPVYFYTQPGYYSNYYGYHGLPNPMAFQQPGANPSPSFQNHTGMSLDVNGTPYWNGSANPMGFQNPGANPGPSSQNHPGMSPPINGYPYRNGSANPMGVQNPVNPMGAQHPAAVPGPSSQNHLGMHPPMNGLPNWNGSTMVGNAPNAMVGAVNRHNIVAAGSVAAAPIQSLGNGQPTTIGNNPVVQMRVGNRALFYYPHGGDLPVYNKYDAGSESSNSNVGGRKSGNA